MRKLIEKVKSLPVIWHVIFVLIALINLAVPLFLYSLENNLDKIENLYDGLMVIESPLSWENSELIADNETLVVNDQFAVSILDGQPEEQEYIYFTEHDVRFQTTGLEFDVEYTADLTDQDDLFLEIVSTAQSNLILQGAVSFILAFFFNGIVYLIMLMGLKYFTSRLYRELFSYLTLPFISVGIVTSLVTLMMNSHHVIIYLVAVLAIGTVTALNVKEEIDKRNTSYYLGNEE